LSRIAALVVPISFMLAACSGGSPAGPSSVTDAGAGSGTVITGAVLGAGGGAGSTGSTGSTTAATGPASSIVVTIVGTSISATVDAKGQFTLTNVPGGTLQLQFTGPNVNGILTLTNIQAGQTIELAIDITSGGVALEGERRSTGSEEQVEGRVESLTPAGGGGTLVVAGRTVTVDADTQILQGNQALTFAALQVGQRVHVKGQPGVTALLANVVMLQNTNVDIPVNLNGMVTGMTGTNVDFAFVVDGRAVEGDTLTEFFGGSVFADLVDGARVEVKGQQRNGFVYATRIHVNRDDDDEDEDEDQASFSGILTAIGPPVATPVLTVGGKTVRTTATTEVLHQSDTLTFAALQVGMRVVAHGTPQPDGSLLAVWVRIVGNH
jgi:hypothetical protein